MATPFSEKERELVIQRLLDCGEREFVRYGLRRARVEDIARGAGIAKGSFYTFFESKEELFLALIVRLERTERAKLVEGIMALPPADRLSALVEAMTEFIRERPFAKSVFSRETFDWLQRKLPEERLREHVTGDENFLAGFLAASVSDGAVGEQERLLWAGALVHAFEAYLRAEESSREAALFLLRILASSWKERLNAK